MCCDLKVSHNRKRDMDIIEIDVFAAADKKV